MKNVIIIGFKTTSEGVILTTNVPARLKTGNTSQKDTYVSWDKIGRLLFDNYTEKMEVTELNQLRESAIISNEVGK